MRPGSVLYLPPGYWHETGQSRQSLSLVFRFNPTSWLDLTIAALRDCLLRDDAWRRAPGSDGDRLPAHDLTRLVEDLLDGARPVGHRRLTARTPLRRCINATLGITTSRGRTLVDLAVVRLGATARREQLTVTAALARVCRWIAQTQTAFTSRDVAAAFARVPRTKIAGLLTRLVRAGYLRALPVR
jgi:50S ribosomal protein L16 3-hydroxylase